MIPLKEKIKKYSSALSYVFGLTALFLYTCSGSSKKLTVSLESKEESGLIAELDGKKFTESNLPKEVGARLYQLRKQEHDILKSSLDKFVLNELVQEESKKKKVDTKKIMESIWSVKEPSHSEAMAFARLHNIDLSKDKTIEDKIKIKLKEIKLSERVESFIYDHLRGHKLVAGFTQPRYAFPVDSDISPKEGEANSKNIIVVLRELGTDHGERVTSIGEELYKKANGYIVYKDFSSKCDSPREYAAQALICLNEAKGTSEYKKMYPRLRNVKSNKDVDSILGQYSKDLLDCLKSNRAKSFANSNLIHALNLGSSGQSALVVNGIVLVGDDVKMASSHIVK